MRKFPFDKKAVELDRIRRELASRDRPWPSAKPIAIKEVARLEASTHLMFVGLEHHYAECILSGRLDVWRAAAIAAVDLMCSTPTIEFVRRDSLP